MEKGISYDYIKDLNKFYNKKYSGIKNKILIDDKSEE